MTTPPDAIGRYHVSGWADGHFAIAPDGRVLVTPGGGEAGYAAIDDVVGSLRRRGLRSPFLLRFPQILERSVHRLHEAFEAARREFDYPAPYRGVYPIKVNQQRLVIEEILSAGADQAHGLEAGSKGELLLALSQDLHPEALILCNGFKDSDYLELALRAVQAGRRVVIIAETLQEVADVLVLAREIGVEPELGLRIRLHSRGVGQWAESGGSRSKFGLATAEILAALQMLAEARALPALRVLHFHIGSQITDILSIKEAVREATRLYCHVRRRATHLDMLDLGGGLAVDYDGSRSSAAWSRNYELEEYCRDCVYHLQQICESEGVEVPTLITESGRAVTAAHAVAIVAPVKLIGGDESPPELPEDPCPQVRALAELLEDLDTDNCRELAKDAAQFHDEVLQAFNLGVVTLEDRAAAEALHGCICRRAWEHLRAGEGGDPDELAALEAALAPQLVCNFSVFQSMPDAWAMRQVFPVLPLSGLAGAELVDASLADITCDSDGRIDSFPRGPGEESRVLPIPRPDMQHPYHLGIFLVGAYQDTLGDFHNLFGSPNEITVRVEPGGTFQVTDRRPGGTVSDTVQLFGYSRELILARFEDRFGDAETGGLKRFRDCYLRVLNSSTYLRR